MQNQLPILIFAQSARFIAQSATLAGYTVWVADCFCDVDTINCSQRYHQLPPLQQLSLTNVIAQLTSLADGQECFLVCGTGIEVFYPALDLLPANIHLLGNSATVIETIKQPQKFFPLLAKLALNYPLTELKRPAPATDIKWLVKAPSGHGGQHVHFLSESPAEQNVYYQQFIDGTSGSACFISNGTDSKLLSINQQYLAEDSFQLVALSTPLTLSQQLIGQLHTAISLICREFSLLGINSLDFIVQEAEIYILEINPRLSASAELLSVDKIFSWHVRACQGTSLVDVESDLKPEIALLSYIFAQHNITIPANMTWPAQCRDIPKSGTSIMHNDPICTLITHGQSHQDCFQQHDVIAKQLQQKLSTLS